jgi:hypothetical protein
VPCAEEARPIEILLVEDSPSDVRLTELALAEGKVLNSLSVAKDGVVALAFLKPVDLDQFMHVIESTEDFWLGVVTLPPK